MKVLLSSLLTTLFVVCFTITLHAGTVSKMTGPELLTRLDSKNLVLLDVRTERDWKASSKKIRGASRMAKDNIEIADQYPRDSIFVLYCA